MSTNVQKGNRKQIFDFFKNDYFEEELNAEYILDRVQDWDFSFMNTIEVLVETEYSAIQPVERGGFIWNCLSWEKPSKEDEEKALLNCSIVKPQGSGIDRKFVNCDVVDLALLPKESMESYIDSYNKENVKEAVLATKTLDDVVKLAHEYTESICKNETNFFVKKTVACFSAYMIYKVVFGKKPKISSEAEDYFKDNFWNARKIIDYTKKVGDALGIMGRHGKYGR